MANLLNNITQRVAGLENTTQTLGSTIEQVNTLVTRLNQGQILSSRQKIVIAIFGALLGGIFLSLLSLLLKGAYLTPVIVIILTIILGIILYFLI